MSKWKDTQWDSSDEDRVLQKIMDIELAIFLVCVAVVVSYFV